MERSVKVLKKKTPTSDNKNEQLKNYQLRNELGQVFGSRKAIKAIRAAERNVVDVAALRSVTAHIQHGIEVGTSALPNKGTPHVTIIQWLQSNHPPPS
jgi:DNA-directed RNA polymerase I subunit RPA49